jgi:hypothetical protein
VFDLLRGCTIRLHRAGSLPPEYSPGHPSPADGSTKVDACEHGRAGLDNRERSRTLSGDGRGAGSRCWLDVSVRRRLSDAGAAAALPQPAAGAAWLRQDRRTPGERHPSRGAPTFCRAGREQRRSTGDAGMSSAHAVAMRRSSGAQRRSCGAHPALSGAPAALLRRTAALLRRSRDCAERRSELRSRGDGSTGQQQEASREEQLCGVLASCSSLLMRMRASEQTGCSAARRWLKQRS